MSEAPLDIPIGNLESAATPFLSLLITAALNFCQKAGKSFIWCVSRAPVTNEAPPIDKTMLKTTILFIYKPISVSNIIIRASRFCPTKQISPTRAGFNITEQKRR